jgi:ADP-ribose pyrophosphatase YjhB (NUDIX family)
MSVDVNALAAIGRDQHLLVIRRREGEPWVLPGTTVGSADLVENVLRQMLADELGVVVTFLSFLALIEHHDATDFGATRHVLSVVFDAGIAHRPTHRAIGGRELRWLSRADLAGFELSPPGLRHGLLSGRFDEGDRWLPWRSSSENHQERGNSE